MIWRSKARTKQANRVQILDPLAMDKLEARTPVGVERDQLTVDYRAVGQILESISDAGVLAGNDVFAPRIQGDFAARADRFKPEAASLISKVHEGPSGTFTAGKHSIGGMNRALTDQQTNNADIRSFVVSPVR
jgi:hypothetical protein